MKILGALLLLSIFGIDIILGYDGDEIDPISGCPMVLRKCKCGPERTKLWKPERNNTYVVNCTKTG